MNVIIKPPREDWEKILQRPVIDNTTLFESVATIIKSVKLGGDDAILKYAMEFDGSNSGPLKASKEEVSKASAMVPDTVRQAIQQAAANIKFFHEKQLTPGSKIETMPGIQCWQKTVPIEKVGLYIPGGTAPLFSTLLMLAIPAKLAGCKDIIVCTPPSKNGTIDLNIAYTATLLGIDIIFKTGGAQAIAAMAFGTDSIPQVYKIFGPGNQYVTAAKQLVQLEGIAIDMPAGPSEVCILADDSANPSFVAADILSQAEHGPDSQAVLITTSLSLVNEVLEQIDIQVKSLDRSPIIKECLKHSTCILVNDIADAILMVNEYAPEHLIVCSRYEERILNEITNAGSVFIGNYSPESAGDYATGTNHTLPTNGFAKAYSGVSVESFVKKISYQKLSQKGLNNISQTVITMAEAEGLTAHANAIKIRSNV